MPVVNVHERTYPGSVAEPPGRLIDGLASDQDRLWPRDVWPTMRFDRPLAVGARGGHGPVRYTIEGYEPGRSITFRFTGPRGFDGTHGYRTTESSEGTVLRHELRMSLSGTARLSWPLFFRPLHDALIEDSLARADAALGVKPRTRAWSIRVRLLRWVATRGRAPAQRLPV